MEELANVNLVELKADCLCNLTKKELHLHNIVNIFFFCKSAMQPSLVCFYIINTNYFLKYQCGGIYLTGIFDFKDTLKAFSDFKNNQQKCMK